MLKYLFLFCPFFYLSFAPQTSFAEENYHTDIRYLYVQKGQTLHNIVARLYPDQRADWPKLTKQIIQLNPHAFIDNDPARMKADVRLELPGHHIVQHEKRKVVGYVALKSGDVVAVNTNKVSRKLDIKSAVYIGDKIITGEASMVQLKMVDKAVLDLSCYTVLVIERYALEKGKRASIINLLKGTLHKVTGAIGHMKDDVYELKTPMASVAVRGTEYALRVYQPKGCSGKLDAEDSMYIRVIKGIVNVHNDAGSTELSRGETAVVPLPTTAPRKEPVKPGILSPVEDKVKEKESDNSGVWWWGLGIVAIALLI
jgi:hypothetical protein